MTFASTPRLRRAGRRLRRRNRQFQNLRRNLGQTPAQTTSGPRFASHRNDEITLAKREQIGTVQPGFNSFAFTPGNSGMLVLDKLAGIFDTYRLRNVRVEFKSSSATTRSGTYVLGIDYNPTSKVSDEVGVQALTESVRDNVYKDCSVNVSVNKAQKQKWLSTATSAADYSKTAFTVVVFGSTDTTDNASLGSVWLEYDLVFASINAASLAGQTNASTIVNQSLLDAPVVSLTTSSVLQPVETPAGPLSFVDNPGVNSDDPTKLVAVTEDIPKDIFHEQGDEITIAQVVDTDVTSMINAPSATVNFLYNDGTPVETGAIQSIPITGYAQFASGYGVNSNDSLGEFAYHELHDASLLASLYKIARPLIKEIPVIGEVATTLFGLNSLSEGEYPESTPITTAIAPGNQLTAVLPEARPYSIADSAPGHCYQTGWYNGVADYTIGTFTSNGPYTFTPNGTRATSVTIEPVSGADPFKAGDLIAVSCSLSTTQSGTTSGFSVTNVGNSDVHTNLQVVDNQADTPTIFGRLYSILRDDESVTVHWGPVDESTPSGSTYFAQIAQLTIARISRGDSVPYSPPSGAVTRRRALNIKAV